jgi:hypothetical protein
LGILASLQARRHEACGEVEGEEAPASEGVFDVVAEDPEEEHVAEQMLEARVHEHRAEGGDVPVLPDDRTRVVHLARVVGELVHRSLRHRRDAAVLVQEVEEDVRDDQPDRHDREAGGRDVVLERDQVADASASKDLTKPRLGFILSA